MSWTDVFPVMSEELIDEYEMLATAEEKLQLEEWYGVKETFNIKDTKHLVSVSLFGKPAKSLAPAHPNPTRDALSPRHEANAPSEPWERHIQPILETVPALLSKFNDTAVRVYLAADMDFLIPDLLQAGCEVCLMKHPSLAHAPGTAWRTLAFAEKNRWVTLADSDRIRSVAHDIKRTRALDQSGLGCWRTPLTADYDARGRVAYRPFRGRHIGLVGGWPMEQLLHAFTWHFARGSFPTEVKMPDCRPKPISAEPWPNSGFEEWFLAVAMYPRLATRGILTFVPTGFHSSLLLMDIEYATWANPKSEVVILPTTLNCSPL
jgi:hypothetical protein